MSRLANRTRNVFNWFSSYCGMALLLLLTASVSAAEQITYYHVDALGSTVAATDESGALLWKEAYRPYGERIRKDDGDTNELWYTGKLHEEAMGLSYFGARWYDPTIGRFMAIDPVGVDEGNIHSFNRYAYANNNPYKFVDPDGQLPILVPILLAVFAEGVNIALEASYDASNPCGDCVRSSSFGVPSGPVAKVAAKLGTNVIKNTPPIKWSAQEKHFPGHNSYTPGRSTMTSDPIKLTEKAGTGQQVGKTPVGQPGSKERVNFGENIGTYFDQAGNASSTTSGIIHYSKGGIHIVPARP